MNEYPVWWDVNLTIYNKYEDPQTNIVTWLRTVVTESFWKYIGEKINVGNTVIETNNTICRIRKDDRFLEKHEWIALPNDKMSEHFTLSPGDIIVKGEVDDVVNEYVNGQRSSDLLKKYKALQGCIVIDEVAINVGAGRCNEHYYVRGI